MKKQILFIILVFIGFAANSQNLQWAKGLGEVESEEGRGVVVDASGNVFSTGAFSGTMDFDPGTAAGDTFFLTSSSIGTNTNIYVLKLNASGNFVWAKSFSGIEYSYGNAIALDGSGNIYTTGYYSGTVDFDPDTNAADTFFLSSAGVGENVFVSKLNSAGNFVWAAGMGGTDNCGGNSVAVDISGNVYTTGYFIGTVDFNPDTNAAVTYELTSNGNNDAFISKLNSSGTFVWAKSLGSTGDDFGIGVTVDNASNVYATGTFFLTVDFNTDTAAGAVSYMSSSGSGDNVYVLKLNSTGAFVWSKGYGGSDYIDVFGMALDGSGNVYTTGYFTGTVDFNADTALAAVANLACTGYEDVFIAKMNSSGNYVWARSFEGTDYMRGTSIAVDASSNVYTTGYLSGMADMNPGPNSADTFYLTVTVNQDVFVSKLGASGNFLWAAQFGSDSEAGGQSVEADNSGYVYLTGYFYGITDFDPNPSSTFNITSAGGSDLFLTKLCSPPLPAATITGNDTLCSGSVTTYSISPALGALSYTWTVPSGSVITSGQNSLSINVTLGTTSGDVTVTPNNTCGSGIANTLPITINLKPTVSFSATPSATVCTSTAVTLSGTGASTYTWTGGITNGVAFTPVSTTTYTVTGTSANSCTSTSSAVVTVNTRPTVNYTVAPSSTVCAGSNVTLSGTGASTYSWTGGITNGVAFSPAITTTYTVTGTAANSCTNTNSAVITVNPIPTAAGPITGPSTFCNGSSATYSINPVNGATSYTWSVPAGSTINSGQNSTTIHMTFGANSGNIAVTPSNTCGSGTAGTLAVTLNPGLAPTVGATVSPASSVCAGTSVTLTGTGASTYSWTGGVTNAVAFTPVSTTTYTVTGTAANGCSSSFPVGITVNPIPTVTYTVSPSSTVCSGTSVTLSGSGANTYTWTGGVTNAVGFTPVSTTTYTVTGTTAANCTGTGSAVITVNTSPTVGTTISPSSTVCTGTSVTLSGTGASTYTWTGGISNGVAFTPVATTTYTVTGTAANTCTSTSTAVITVNTKPTVGHTAAPTSTVCSGSTVTLSGTGASTYSWTGGVTNAVAFTPAVTTTYTVTGTAANSCTNTDTAIITVVQPPGAAGAVTGPASLCDQASATYSLNAVAGATTYTWSVPSGTTIVSGQSTTTLHIVFGNTSGNVTVTPSNICGSGTFSSVAVTANPTLAPNVGITFTDDSLCAGDTVMLTGTGALSYSWDNGVSNGVPFNPDSTVVYTVTGTAAGGCTNSSSIAVVVTPTPVVGIIASPSDTLCYGDSITLSGTGADLYVWSGGITDGVAFLPSQSFDYYVTGTTIDGCVSEEDTISIVVHTSPTVGFFVAPFSTVCNGTTVVLNGTGADTFVWTGGITDGVPFTPAITATYSVTGTDTTGGCSSTNSVVITVVETPVITAQPSDQNVTETFNANFSVSVSTPGVTYQWQENTGLGWTDVVDAGQYSGSSTNSLTIFQVTLSQTNYTYRCVIINGNCTDTTNTALLLVIPIGIDPIYKENFFTVFPNPAYDHITINSINIVKKDVYEILDGGGRRILIGTLNGKTTDIDISNLAAGFYFIQIKGIPNKPVRFIKQ